MQKEVGGEYNLDDGKGDEIKLVTIWPCVGFLCVVNVVFADLRQIKMRCIKVFRKGYNAFFVT